MEYYNKNAVTKLTKYDKIINVWKWGMYNDCLWKTFKEEAVKLSDEIGLAKASEQLGILYDTLSGWRQKRKKYNEKAHVGNENKRTQSQSSRENELEKENAELRRANEILKDTLAFFVKDSGIHILQIIWIGLKFSALTIKREILIEYP